ncbi:unnamed protein product, partial [Lampetra planeri]
ELLINAPASHNQYATEANSRQMHLPPTTPDRSWAIHKRTPRLNFKSLKGFFILSQATGSLLE